MAKNKIQFQKGMSFDNFMEQYATENKCRDQLFELRWPSGFEGPFCGNKTYCEIHDQKVFQCNRCHHQASVTAGTIFHSTHLPLTKWFLTMFLVTQSKNGISVLELCRQIGVSYNTAWRVKHKIMQVMLERDSTKPISGRIEIDDSYLGAKRVSGKRGCGAGRKPPFVAAVETTDDKKPLSIKLSKIEGFSKEEIKSWSVQHLTSGCMVVSDGYSCFKAVVNAGCSHNPYTVGGGKQAVEHPAFKWVNTILGNVKNSLRGTYQSFSKKHIPRYLAEF